MKPASARKPPPTSPYLADQSRYRALWFQDACAALPLSAAPVHWSARSGRLGVNVSLNSHWPLTTSAAEARHWKSGPARRLCELPSVPSRSVTSAPTNDNPRSRFARPTNTVEWKSCGADDEPFGPGRMTLPPPASSVTSAVKRTPPSFPVIRPPQVGDVIVRV